MDTKKYTILCVDDEKDILDSLRDTFMDNYNVKIANSGAEALQIFSQEDVAVVISDQRMPQMEGIDLLARITELKPTCKKILLTGYADINAAVGAINKGAVNRYFSKPWDDAELIKAVETLVGKFENETFFEQLIEETRGVKEKVKRNKSSLDLLENFMKSYLYGVSLVSPDNTISFINSAGLEMMKYGDPDQLLGKNIDVVFSLTNPIKSFFLEQYTHRKQVFETVNVKTGDGSFASMQATLIFSGSLNSLKISGIVFRVPSLPLE